MSLPVNNTVCPELVLGLAEIIKSDLELWIISLILSAMAYGGVLSLTLSYLPLLLKSSYDISRRMRIFLLVYVTFMLAISTLYIITSIIDFRTTALVYGFNKDCSGVALPSGTSPEWLGFAGATCLTLASWGADGFMLWRCAMLYEGVSRPRRVVLLSVLGIMALMSLGTGLAFLISEFYFFLAMTAMTVILNIVTATLITCRILYFDRRLRKTMGLEHNNSPYLRVIVICVESSALIVVFGLIYLVLTFKVVMTRPFETVIPLQLLVHVYAISPLLIVYRVARGRAVTIRRESALRFEPPPLSSINNDVVIIDSSDNFLHSVPPAVVNPSSQKERLDVSQSYSAFPEEKGTINQQ